MVYQLYRHLVLSLQYPNKNIFEGLVVIEQVIILIF